MQNALSCGAAGILVAIITWLLASAHARTRHRRDQHSAHVAKLEALYAATIETLEMMIRVTESHGRHDELAERLSKNNAMLALLSTEPINHQIDKVSRAMEAWSTAYRQGNETTQNHAELWPAVNGSIAQLTSLMARHLRQVRNG